ncbi:DUF4344 domain-containing metallopeptidase [uncultured Shewanella sp.]|uniref:DUF4344 domain-containing metallopeptidase n=1 Tax=uncultured Shewanella sp. TaxID=173975 RepID=UPI0026317DB7|nr:DUF4344 domain-containing metallopeptidase [uncultured Shewanella sp.]
MHKIFLLMTACITFCAPQILASTDKKAVVLYAKPANTSEAMIKNHLINLGLIDEIVVYINEEYLLPQTLTFKIGARDGPLYDPISNEIFIPYFFIKEAKNRFSDAHYSETRVSVDDATWDALMHTLLHELAHALIAIYNLPVVGKEEDAADSLATILLIEFFNEGTEIAISAADLFYLESEDIVGSEEDYWDEHSLDIQRFYSTICLVYGSSPEKYIDLVNDMNFSEKRLTLCIDEYQNLLDNWIVLLKPHLKPMSRARMFEAE